VDISGLNDRNDHMTQQEAPDLCPEEDLASLVEELNMDERQGYLQLQRLLAVHRGDARLQFLNGSLLAARGDFTGARAAMREAVDMAPDFVIARFQLGFMHLTCGDAMLAQEAWGPLHGLPEMHYLRLFVTGLCHMIRDEFVDAVRMLEKGIEQNDDNLPLNRDMQLIIEEIRARPDEAQGDQPLSSVHMLLQQSALKGTRH
jgi:tetratricopeptide (TPR) repeat protein